MDQARRTQRTPGYFDTASLNGFRKVSVSILRVLREEDSLPGKK
jgi:hypothetical protein